MKRKNKYRGTRIELLVIFTACMFRIGWEYRLTLNYQRQQEELRAIVEETDSTVATEDGENSATSEETEEDVGTDGESVPEAPVILEKYAKLHTENEDMVGWLEIPGTSINYPVMQRAGNEY